MILSLRSRELADIVYDVPELQTNYFYKMFQLNKDNITSYMKEERNM